MSEKDRERFISVLKNNWDGLDTINQKVFMPMYGYKTLKELSYESSVVNYYEGIMVPTFTL